MSVNWVSLGAGKYLKYANDQKKIVVYLDRPYGFADTLKLSVDYSCSPKEGLYFIAPDSVDPDDHRQIWTQGEDMDNHHWFPCWDYPNDKATSEVIGTVPETWTLLSNGKLVAEKHDKKSRSKTFHWLQSKPHVSYLIMLAAGEYTIVTEKNAGVPIDYYAYSNRVEDARRSLAATPDIMRFFERTIGYPYPWDKYSQIFIDDFMWGGMENTSATTLNTSFLIDDRGRLDFTADDVNAHEMAHQWFGDLVSFRDWSHLWLSEGFANYFEALYKKQAKGLEEFHNDLMGQASSVISVERVQGRKPIVSNESFTTNLYSKGAWVLYMLHNILGDEQFHRAIRLYVQRHAYTSVSTFEFMRAVEDATGENLDWFFNQWVFKAGHPKLKVTQEWDEKSNVLNLTIRQTQTLDSLTDVFMLPIEVEVTTSNGRIVRNAWLKRQDEAISIPLADKPLMVIVDRGMKTLKSLTFEKSKEENIYQLLNATDIADRIAAAKALKEFSDDRSVFDALRTSSLRDKFWVVRREATNILANISDVGVKGALFEVYRDKKSDVRNAAIIGLEDQKGDDVAQFLKQALSTDSSYVVQSSCLQSLAAVDSSSAVLLARQYVDKESHRDILRRGALNVLRMVRSRESLPSAQKYVRLGYPSDIRAMALGVLRDVGEGDEVTRSLVLKLVDDSDVSIRKGVVRVLEQWGGDDAKLALERRKTIEKDESLKRMIDSSLETMTK
jgi:aminopeptidase N